MSASASKKKRKELEGQGLSPRNIADKTARDQKNKTLRNILIVALTLIVCAAIVFGAIKLVNRPSYDTKAAVVTVGSESISVPVYNYFYSMAASEVNSYYSAYIQSNVPVSQQSNLFGDGTLEDYLKQYTNSSLQAVLNVVADAKAHNFQLSDEEKASIESSAASLEEDYEQYKAYYSNIQKYFEARFGEGCDMDNFKEYLTLATIYSSYLTKASEEFKPSAEELAAAYQKDTSAYDLVSYSYALSEAEATETEKADGDADSSTTKTYTDLAKAAAAAQAEAYTKNMPEDAIRQTYARKTTISSRLNSEVADWLFDDARKEGDVMYFASNEEGILYYTVRFDGRETNDYCLVNANIITIAKDKEGSEPAEGEKSAAQKHSDLLAAIHDGMTDDEFVEAAKAQNISTGTMPITKGYAVPEIVSFLFDESRKEGDLFTAFEDDTYYYVVRYSSTQEESYRDQQVRSSLWTEHYNELTTANELKVDENMMQYANTDVTFYNNNSSSSSES